MKTEKELKKEIVELKKNAPKNIIHKLELIELYVKLETLNKRNAEVKQAIENDWLKFKKVTGINKPHLEIDIDKSKKELLQKLGLGEE